MKKLIAEKNSRNEKLSGIFIGTLVVLVAIMAVSRVLIANRLVEASEKLRTMDKTIEIVQNENQRLSEELRLPRSISTVSQKIEQLGFSKNTQVFFLAQPTSVALLQ